MNPTSYVVIAALLASVGCEKAKDSADSKVQPGLSIQVPRTPPKVGEQLLELEETAMEMSFDVKGQTIKAKMKGRTELLSKVLAVDGFAPSRIQLTYKTVSEEEEMMGKTEAKSDPRQGKTYIVARENGQLRATYEDGTVPPAEELAEVLDDKDEVGVPDEMDAVIAARTWKSGERYTFTADELARINAAKEIAEAGHDTDKERMTKIELMLRSAKDGVAVFSLVMGVDVESDEGNVSFELKGDAHVDQTTGRLIEIGGKGVLGGSVQGMPMKGSVTMKVQSRWTTAP